MGESLKYTEVDKPCDICGSKDSKQLREKPIITRARIIKDGDKVLHGTDVICNECGLIYKRPMLDEDSVVSFYESNDYIKLYDPGVINGIPKRGIVQQAIDSIYFMEWVKKNKFDIDGKNILMIGAGLGVLSYYLRSHGAIITNIEPGSRAAEIGKKLFYLDYYNGDLRKYVSEHGNRDAKFDIAIFSNSLEHFYSARKALDMVRGLLKLDGMVWIEIPNVKLPYPNIAMDAWFSSAHVYSYDSVTISNLCKYANLLISHLSYDGYKSKMLICAKYTDELIPTDKQLVYHSSKLYVTIMDIFRERELNSIEEEHIAKELSSNQDVKGYIVNFLKQKPYTSNTLLLSIAEFLVKNMRGDEALYLLNNVQWIDGQPGDIMVNKGTRDFLIAIALRNKGDLISAKKYIDSSLSQYPPIDSCNVFKDMLMNGIASSQAMQEFHFYQAKEFKKIHM